jgi:glyoxylase-like metal-dependent hydrolase (beta-lactamase superfamily II)
MLKWRIGDVTVTKIVELEMTGGSKFILPQATPEAVLPLAWMKPYFMSDDGRLKMSVHALVVEAPGRRIVVDTCIGNDKKRAIPNWTNLQLPFLADLAAAGFDRASIDTVMCTHLHVDHVGWNTMLVDGRWVPTFPNARYLMAESEFAHWQAQEDDSGQRDVFEDSVRPVFEAGLVDLVATDHVVCPEVRFVPTHGHTPGHVSVLIESRGERALITGDFIHHPCQLAHIDWSSSADFDAVAGIETRRRVFSDLEGTPTLVIGTHFAGATAGRIVRDGGAWRLEV